MFKEYKNINCHLVNFVLVLVLTTAMVIENSYSKNNNGGGGNGDGGNNNPEAAEDIPLRVNFHDNFMGEDNRLTDDVDYYSNDDENVYAVVGENRFITMDFNTLSFRLFEGEIISDYITNYVADDGNCFSNLTEDCILLAPGCVPKDVEWKGKERNFVNYLPESDTPNVTNNVDVFLGIIGEDHDDTPLKVLRMVNAGLKFIDNDGEEWLIVYGKRPRRSGILPAPCSSDIVVERIAIVDEDEDGYAKAKWNIYTTETEIEGIGSGHFGYLYKIYTTNNGSSERKFRGIIHCPFSVEAESINDEPVPLSILDFKSKFGSLCDTDLFFNGFANDIHVIDNIDGDDIDKDGWYDCDNCTDSWDPYQTDTDGDCVGDIIDNCPSTFNPDQADVDGDGIGDACDSVINL